MSVEIRIVKGDFIILVCMVTLSFFDLSKPYFVMIFLYAFSNIVFWGLGVSIGIYSTKTREEIAL